MKELIQKSNIIDYEGITKNFRELRVNDLYTLERLNKMDDEDKALNLEKMLKQEISINLEEDPAYQKFSERLSAIRKEFEQNQIDLAERIRRYEELMKDIRTKRDEAKEMGLDLKEYALYVISQEFITGAKDEDIIEFVSLRSRVEDDVDAGWQESSKRDAFVKDIKQTLQEPYFEGLQRSTKREDFPKFLNRLVDIISKNSNHLWRKDFIHTQKSKRAKEFALRCIVMEMSWLRVLWRRVSNY